jgi:DNA segregation ATPase FtsK/SpoIIIE, S-DNA-T family
MRESKRRTGAEFRVALWLARHPHVVGVPAALGAGMAELGATTTGGIVGSAALGLAGWYRAHPNSFDHLAAPRLRALRRRWFSRYTGRFWHDVVLSCDLAPVHRKTGEFRFPRVLRVRSYSPTIDTVWIRLVPGQSAKDWQDRAEALADALKVERVGIERVRPQVIGLVVQRAESFTEVIDAPEMPTEVDAVDLHRLYVGEDEYGHDWHERLPGNQIFVASATGGGKNSIGWDLLRDLAPLIRDGLCRVWMLDPKRVELAAGKGLAYRYAAEPDDMHAVAEEYVEDLRAGQRRLAETGDRKVTAPSRQFPINVLMMDEIGHLMAYGEASHARDYRRWFAEIGSQGRATMHSMMGFVQEPTKDVVPIRELFTTRICLRVTAANHVDMVLGDGARLRGALADEIPNDPATAGIGYVIRQRSRTPMRVRAAYVDDHEIAELVEFVQRGNSLRVVA